MAGRGRGRGRKRRAECEYREAAKKIHKTTDYDDQDYPFSPPFSLRCSSSRPTMIKPIQGNGDNKADDLSVEIISEIQGPQEIESSFNDAFEYVQGHRVKAEFAPLLKGIFHKYGDITRGSDVKSSNLLSTFLERICHVYQRLERTNFLDLTRAEIDSMISELRHLESRKLSVGWILERLEYMSHTKISFQYQEWFKEQEAEFDASIDCLEKDLGLYEREICLLQQKISSTKVELVLNQAKKDQIKEAACDIKARFSALQKQSLVHGFL
ncbi:hypothetical protein C2S51_013764 [Perilla frutescens var. frutescens]|nr:hypothetical protein C2S51_013764 [Perilla frutescens var. frutescens]